MTASSSELLFDILQANVPHMLAPKLSGFEEKNVGVLFLRELVHVSDDRFDALFEVIIDRTSLNPYHLYQTIKYLEENNAIAVTPDRQGYILQNDHVWRLLSDLSDGVNDVLKRRWEFTSKTIPEENLFRICSVLFLFEKIDKFHRVCFDIDPFCSRKESSYANPVLISMYLITTSSELSLQKILRIKGYTV